PRTRAGGARRALGRGGGDAGRRGLSPRTRGDRGAGRPALRGPGLRAGHPHPWRRPRRRAPRRPAGCFRPRIRHHLRLLDRRAARARERPGGGHGTARAPARLPQRADRRRAGGCHPAPGRTLGAQCAARRHAGSRARRHRARIHAGTARRRRIRLHRGGAAGRERVPGCLRQPGPHPGAAVVTLDPITFAVIKSALDAIVDEMAYAVIRTARSEIIRDVMDYSAALCDAEGRMVAQAKTIAQHLGAVPDAMQSVRRQFAGDLHPGDVVMMNDPYEGGMHIPDVFLFMPIFVEGTLEAFAVVIGHQTDMGGRVPGSNASDSTEVYQEGLRIPPVKLYERGVLSRTMQRIIEKNVRVPERVLGDLGAQYAACKVGERELGKLFARYGRQTMHAHVAELLDYAERVTRAEIARWPRGTYRFTDHLDSDGLSDDPVPLTVAITVHDDGHLTCDWTGSSPQVRAALNSTLSFTKSCTYLSVRSVLRQDVPNNAGVFRCIDVIAPEGTILNPRLPG